MWICCNDCWHLHILEQEGFFEIGSRDGILMILAAAGTLQQWHCNFHLARKSFHLFLFFFFSLRSEDLYSPTNLVNKSFRCDNRSISFFHLLNNNGFVQLHLIQRLTIEPLSRRGLLVCHTIFSLWYHHNRWGVSHCCWSSLPCDCLVVLSQSTSSTMV